MANKDGNQEDRYDTDDERTKTKKGKGASGSATHERGTANDWTKSGTKMPKNKVCSESKSTKRARRAKAKIGRTADTCQGAIPGKSVSPDADNSTPDKPEYDSMGWTDSGTEMPESSAEWPVDPLSKSYIDIFGDGSWGERTTDHVSDSCADSVADETGRDAQGDSWANKARNPEHRDDAEAEGTRLTASILISDSDSEPIEYSWVIARSDDNMETNESESARSENARMTALEKALRCRLERMQRESDEAKSVTRRTNADSANADSEVIMADEPAHKQEPIAVAKPKGTSRRGWQPEGGWQPKGTSIREIKMNALIAADPEAWPNTYVMSDEEAYISKIEDKAYFKARRETQERIQKLRDEGLSETEATEKEQRDRVKREARKQLQKTESKSTKRARRARAKVARSAGAAQGAIPSESEGQDSDDSTPDKPRSAATREAGAGGDYAQTDVLEAETEGTEAAPFSTSRDNAVEEKQKEDKSSEAVTHEETGGYAAAFSISQDNSFASRDHGVEEEKKGVESNETVNQNASQDNAVGKEKKEDESNEAVNQNASQDHAIRKEKKGGESNNAANQNASQDIIVGEDKKEDKSNEAVNRNAIQDHAVRKEKREKESGL